MSLLLQKTSKNIIFWGLSLLCSQTPGLRVTGGFAPRPPSVMLNSAYLAASALLLNLDFLLATASFR